MNQLKITQHPVSDFVFTKGNEVMTDSLIIARMFGKEHKNVMADIRKTIDTLEQLKNSEEIKEMGINMGSLKFQHTSYIHQQNKQTYPKYLLNFDSFMLVTMGYTTQRAMIVKIKYINEFNRMKEYIESQQPNKLPTTFAEALRLAADLEEEKQQLLIENQEMKPKAQYFDIVLDSTSTYTVTQIANELGISSAKALNKILHEKNVQRRVGGQWVLYAKHQGKGYIDTKTFTFDKNDGSRGSNQQLRWTEKGRRFIHELLNTDKNLQIM
ncbi:Rha family transcriptional regulator [Bacillus cytotoxicus]|uniref:Rha family transcriptional regulator n=1 Tax=Bacillus cytotoxicus TaxID=580165 RepID=UPI003B7C1579